ncbi:MAG: family 10 glycosylhydrolase [Candidatus Marinimicrobia bacterium]|nr:family 10 glycosylhydrolase [Candidatus Neomarinimicrobiota bacterium]
MKDNTRVLIKYLMIATSVIMLILIIMALFEKPVEEPPRKIISPSRELRGVWMSRFDYSQSLDTTDKTVIQRYIQNSFQQVRDANCNIVFFQVRGNADAFYKSSYEPWSHLLSGTLGADPGWDPLQFAIKTAHDLGLELHAWINAFPAWRGKSDPAPSNPVHPYSAHPEWLVCDSSGNQMPKTDHYVSFSPGNLNARQHIKNVVMEITSKYDIDGIHFDYIRYPEGSTRRGYSHDAESLKRFNSAKGNPLRLDWEDWQREQVTQFIAGAYNAITAIKPWVKVSAAVIGNYNMPGWNGYHKVFQDAARWADIGKIDMIIPMTYRSRKNRAFQKSIQLWNSIPNIDQPIAAGLGVFNLPFDEVLQEIDDSRFTGLSGVVFFAVSSVDSLEWIRLRNEKFPYPAIPPALPWKFSEKPPEPEECFVTIDSPTLNFSWTNSGLIDKGNSIRKFVIYRSIDDTLDISDGASIFAILPGNTQQYQTAIHSEGLNYQYYITALDAANNESNPALFSDSKQANGASQ